MNSSLLIKDVHLVNEGKIICADVLIQSDRIVKIASHINATGAERIIEGRHGYLLPGMIDDQVHFRQPGLTHKGTIASESQAAVVGGTTTVMDMPNVQPPTLTLSALEQKFQLAEQRCATNYSFYLGASADNLEQIKRLDPAQACGVKIFMGSSTGQMQIDDPDVLAAIFRYSPVLVATHCESDAIIAENFWQMQARYGEDIPMHLHPEIRSEQACYASSSLAVELARRERARLHVLHLTTEKELQLFQKLTLPALAQADVTAEVCVHHLTFSDADYGRFGTLIKCNPAIKKRSDQMALIDAVNRDVIDVIATDHAPHTWVEKQQRYAKAPAGIPLCQHSLQMLLELYHRGWMTLEKIVQKTAHAVANRYEIKDRGYIREGYFADLVLVDLHKTHEVTQSSLRYRCGWSPFTHHCFRSSIASTIVNGQLAWHQGQLLQDNLGQRLVFDRARR